MDREERDFSRILVILLSPIGDTLFATPALHALRQRYPEAYLAALAYPTNKGILDTNPDLDDLLVHPILHPLRRLSDLFLLYRRLRGHRFDLTVNMTPLTWYVTRLICGISPRVTLPFKPFWWALPLSDASWKARHAVDHYLCALRPMGIQSASRELRLFLTEEDRGFALHFLEQQGVRPGEPLVAIHPGGEGLKGKKRWQAEGFAQVADALARLCGARILLLGGEDERHLAGQVASGMETLPLSGVGKATLRQTAALIERCLLFIGNDSSPLHLATAVGVPALGIFGPSSPDNFRPLGPRADLVRRELPCSPCFHFVGATPLWRRPACGERRCLKEITPQEVLAAAVALLRSAPTGARRRL